MSNQLMHILARWHPLRNEHKWVVGLIYKTEGSCYRKAGALMFFSDAGHQFGILSGGCLESDINKKAQRVMHDGQPRMTVYDDNDEEDIAFKLGVGCGGVVHLALLPVAPENQFLQLETVYSLLLNGQACWWQQEIGGALTSLVIENNDDIKPYVSAARLIEGEASERICVPCIPPVHLLIVGGGYDARFMVNLALSQGWTVSLWDPRPAQARVEHFSNVHFIVESSDAQVVRQHISEHNICAAVLMSHHRTIDSTALNILKSHKLKYIALLGPKHRKAEIFALAEVTDADFEGYFSSPAGFDIGGDLPESIALSIVAECHGVLAGKIPPRAPL